MPTLNDVLAGSLAQAVQLQQVIDALKGTPNKGVPIAMTALNDPNNYALTVQNDDPTNSRALSVLKADGTGLITADANGVALGGPLTVPVGSITSAAIADGTITGADIANGSITANKLESRLIGATNQLVNGGMEVWQRGNGPFTSLFCADRWQVYAPAGTTSVSRDAANIDSPSTAAAGITIAAPSTNGIYQILTESANQLAGQTLTLTARVRCAQATSVRIGLQSNRAASPPTVWSAYHSGGGGYETLSVTFAIAGGTAGVTAWILGSVAGTFQVDNIMLVLGSTAADYVPLHPADDLARCVRYYAIIGETTGAFVVTGYQAAGANHDLVVPFKARTPVAPTVTKVGTWALTNCSQPTIAASGLDNTVLRIPVTALGSFSVTNNAGSAITVESNP